MKKMIFLIPVLMLFLGSCVSQKELTYLQDKSQDQLDSLGYEPLTRSDYLIQVNDILNVNIKSFDEKSANIFNAYVESGTVQINDAIIYIKGNSVDSNGNIEIPVIGLVHVEGKTLSEVKEAIEIELFKYFKKEAVYLKVQLAGIRYSIVGEVNRPGKYVIYQNQVNIFEAIANAGDINQVGHRDRIQIVRQLPEGVKIFEIDLTDKNVIRSPYYFLQPNDIINIPPRKAKSWGWGTEGFSSLLSVLTLISTSLLIIYNVEGLSNK